ncbi:MULTISPECIES: TorD/DmsD family molecular chaperone [Desulfosediminicola]|uniref:TorD/DmsD family molecular chaperone n=1 Tax=Desulfosediminicola TaxID=2886823 RepID=UPI0010AD516B|nr:molecular chaperone TorD family protein [Desulfosediminicola ganghwensis]
METNNREIFRVRLLFVDLLKSFYQSEPDSECMSRWRGTFSALAREQVSPLFDNAVRELNERVNGMSLTDIQNEYYELFTNPFSKSQVNTLASYYLDGRSFGESLVELRELLAEAKLQREEGVVDSEDSLPMLLDIFARLIEEEKNSDSDSIRQLQGRLLTNYLVPFSKEFSEAVNGVEAAQFYRSCCRLLCGYLDLEKSLVDVSQA